MDEDNNINATVINQNPASSTGLGLLALACAFQNFVDLQREIWEATNTAQQDVRLLQDKLERLRRKHNES